jgi:hypothetical protein
MKKNLLAAIVFLLTMFFGSSKAQDTIHLHNGGTIDCLVKEIGTNEIKYVKKAFREDLVFSVIRKDVLKIAFADGNIWENDLSPELLVNGRKDSEDLYNIQKKNAWKMDFLNLVGNTFTLTYEKALKNGNSLDNDYYSNNSEERLNLSGQL